MQTSEYSALQTEKHIKTPRETDDSSLTSRHSVLGSWLFIDKRITSGFNSRKHPLKPDVQVWTHEESLRSTTLAALHVPRSLEASPGRHVRSGDVHRFEAKPNTCSVTQHAELHNTSQ